MKKFIFSLMAILAMAASSKATVLAVYDFSSTHLLTSSDGDALSTASDITKVGLSSSSVRDATVGSGSFKFYKNDMSATLNTGNYITFTVTASSGNYINLNTATLSFKTSTQNVNTGNYAVFYAVNGSGTFTSLTSGTIPSGNGFLSSSVGVPSQLVTSVTFQFCAFNDRNIDLYYDDISLDAGVTPVPEPTNIALVLFGCTFAGVGVSRKFLKKKA